jgi:hypothetical protein
MTDYYNPEYHANVNQAASNAAQAAYNEAKLRLESEQLALQKAQQAWKETVDKAGLTGFYEGQATMPTQQWWAQTFGQWDTPQAGQQTLAAQQQQWAQAAQQAAQFGQWYAPGSAPQTGAQTLGAQQQQFAQAIQAQQEARAAQAQQQQQAQSYLQLMTQLRGPADWAKYQEVLGATPGGMRDLVAAAMGQYIPGGGATSGVQPQAATLQTLQQQIAGGGGQPTMSVQGGQPGTGTPQEAMGGGTNTMGQLPAPNQIAPQAWKNLAPSQQQLLMGAYEGQGWHKDDVRALLEQSLPRYASNAPGAGTWRLAA